jgi:hypothetical protein
LESFDLVFHESPAKPFIRSGGVLSRGQCIAVGASRNLMMGFAGKKLNEDSPGEAGSQCSSVPEPA